MKVFEERQLREAVEFAAGGGQALHLFSDPGVYPSAPLCFKRPWTGGAPRSAGHLFDQDLERLIATARQLRVRVIKVHGKGTPKQHIDLCGRPLRWAIEVCEVKNGQSGIFLPRNQ